MKIKDNIPKLSIENIDKLPKEAGVYLVLDKDEEVIYVGKAKNLYRRWKSWKSRHHKRKEFIKRTNVKVAYRLTPYISELETRLIYSYKPCLNIALTEKSPSAKLTPAIVSNIRILKRKGVDKKTIAKKFNIASSTVIKIAGYRNWKYVPDKPPFLLTSTWKELLLIYGEKKE